MLANEFYSTRILGDIYFAKGDDEKALNCYRKYMPEFIKYNKPGFIEYKQNSRDLGFVFNSMSKIFQKRNQNDSAIFYAKKALSNAQEYQDEENIYNSATSLYNFYNNKNDSKKIQTTKDGFSNFNKLNHSDIIINDKAGRKKIDSLTKEIILARNDTAKIILLEQLGQAYRDEKKIDSSILMYKHALDLNQKTNYSPLKQCYNMSTMAYLYYVTGNYTKSLDCASKVLVLSERLHDIPQMAHAHQQFGFNYVAFGNYRTALYHFFKAKQLFERHNHPEIDLESPAFATVYIGYIYLKLNQPDSALTYVQSGYKLASAMSLQYVIDFALRIFGDIFLKKNNHQLALHYYRQYINDFYKYKEKNRDIGFVFNSMSKIFQKRNQKDSAIFYAKKALTNAGEYKDQQNIYNASNFFISLNDSIKNRI